MGRDDHAEILIDEIHPCISPLRVALRSKSVPDGFVTKDFAVEWNNRVYFRLSNYFVDLKIK